MDLAYDHIVEESLPKEDDGKKRREGGSGAEQAQQSLNAEFQDAYKAFSASPWGAKIGGFFGNVVKQVRKSSKCPDDNATQCFFFFFQPSRINKIRRSV